MTTIQLSLLDLISCCLKELKKLASFVGDDFLTLDNALTASFDKVRIIIYVAMFVIWLARYSELFALLPPGGFDI